MKATEYEENLNVDSGSLTQHDYSDAPPLIGLSALALNDIEEPLLIPDDDERVEDESEEEIPLVVTFSAPRF